MIDSKENCRVKEGLSKEVIFKLRSDEGEGSRHVKKKKKGTLQIEGIACFLIRGRAWHAIGIKKATTGAESGIK